VILPLTPSLRALLFGSVPILAWMNDWYVDVNSPGCPGTGTQADPFCAIMQAVNAAADGDAVHIAQGTYFENVVLDKNLSLIGTGGEQVTILDGMASGSVVQVVAGVVSLTGLTLTNGSGTPTDYGRHGGGLLVIDLVPGGEQPNVTMSHCSVTNSSADTGGGISVLGGDLTITNSMVSGNAALGRGGGIHADSVSLTLTNSTVSWNIASSSGGIHADNGITTLANSSISTNTATYYYVAGNQTYFGVGGLTKSGGRLEASDVVLDSNSGHGMELSGGSSCVRGICIPVPLVAEVNGVSIHDSSESGLQIGADVDLTLVNSQVTGNGAVGISVLPSGLWSNRTFASIVNSTVSQNAGSGLALHGGMPEVELLNSILWGNGGSIDVGAGAFLVVERSLVEGGWPGVGNLDLDPLFVDPLNGDFRLQSGSPCIDAGCNFFVPPGIETDLGGLPRFLDDLLTPDTGIPFRFQQTSPSGFRGRTPSRRPVVDLGAYEFP